MQHHFWYSICVFLHVFACLHTNMLEVFGNIFWIPNQLIGLYKLQGTTADVQVVVLLKSAATDHELKPEHRGFLSWKVYFTSYYSTWRVVDGNGSSSAIAGTLMKEALAHFYQKMLECWFFEGVGGKTAGYRNMFFSALFFLVFFPVDIYHCSPLGFTIPPMDTKVGPQSSFHGLGVNLWSHCTSASERSLPRMRRMPDTIVIYRSGASESQETALMEPRECHGHGEYGEEFENTSSKDSFSCWLKLKQFEVGSFLEHESSRTWAAKCLRPGGCNPYGT